MRKIESLFIGGAILATVVGTGIAIWNWSAVGKRSETYHFPTSKYGAFLAAQHAVYVNDFDTAAIFTADLQDVDFATVRSVRYLSEFLGGKLPADSADLKNDKTVPARIIYDAYLVSTDNWDAVYKNHRKDESALAAPLRIWSSVATGRKADALKFIKTLPTNDSWKAFVRGQIYAETGDAATAAKEFAAVRSDFMNINDYMYIMAFYQKNNMSDAADKLRTEFTARPGGMYMLDYDNLPTWDTFSGYKNALAFSLVQNVSHTQIMMYSDLSLLLLRFAQITGPNFGADNDAVNYYLGQFFFNNAGDYDAYFSKIKSDSPFYLFGVLRTAERSGDVRSLRAAVRQNPLFVPATGRLVAYYVQNGERRAALRTVNNALDNPNLTSGGRAFFLKTRANIHYVFGDFDAAAHDIKAASSAQPVDGDILALQAKIWAAQNREIENAYDYAMTLVRKNPTDIMAWDTLGVVVAAREGAAAGIEILSRVGEVSVKCSSLFMHLGDMYVAVGEYDKARDAYMRAIDLSDDGLVSVPTINKKLRILR